MKTALIIIGVLVFALAVWFLMPGTPYVSREGCVRGKVAVSLWEFKEVCNN